MSQFDNFEQVLRQNGPAIYSLAVRLSGNLTDGEDLAQETFLKAYEKWDQFRAESSVKTWLFRICVNLWKNRVRYERRRHFWRHLPFGFSGRDGDQPELDVAAAELDAGTNLEKADDQSRLQEALSHLTPEERGILVLRDVQGQSYEEIAAQLDIPLGTVRSRLARTRDKLRELFAPEPDAPNRAKKALKR